MLAWSGLVRTPSVLPLSALRIPRCVSALRDERLLAEDCIRGGEDVEKYLEGFRLAGMPE